MNTTSLFYGFGSKTVAEHPSTHRPNSGFWRRMVRAVVTAREMQAQREVNRYLARQPDRLLHDIGLDDDAIAGLRARYGG